MQYDLCIIGSGPAGYVGAIRASQLGLKVCIIEANHLGGICLNWGCIPTKALLKTSELFYKIKHASDYGIKVEAPSFDIKDVIKRSRDVSLKLSGGVQMLLKKHKVDIIEGYGRIETATSVALHDKADKTKKIKDITTKHIMIATGASARVLPGFESDAKLVWTYKEALNPDIMPKTMAIIGSGAIGSEFASFYQNMGAQVYLLEGLDRILPNEDEEIGKIAHKAFEKQGIKIETSIKLEKITKKSNSLSLHYSGKTLEVDRLIMAVGVTPNTSDIGLEKLKIKTTDKGIIEVNDYCQTNIPNIWAVGDVTQGPWLAHKASHEAVIVAEKIANALGKYDAKSTHPLKRSNIPGCTYTRPQIASVGLTEKQAKEKGYDLKIGRFNPIGNGKAIASNELEGLVKVIYDSKTGELLGAHLIGADVTEMLPALLVAKTGELVELDLMHTIFPHPTMSEMIHEAVLDAFGKVIHM